MQVFSVFCENPQGDNILQIICANNEEEAKNLFLKKIKYKKTDLSKFKKYEILDLIKNIKEEIKSLKKDLKNNQEDLNYYLNYDKYCVGNFKFNLNLFINSSKEEFIELIRKNFIEYYYKKDFSLEYHLDNSLFEIKNLSNLCENSNKSFVVKKYCLYHGV